MSFLQTLHGEIRWIVLLVAIVAIIRFALGWLQGRAFKPLDRRLMSAFAATLGVNWLLGVILLVGLGISQGIWPGNRWEHALTMTLALVIGSQGPRWRNLVDHRLRFRNNLILIVLSLVLILLGVIRLRGGWLS